MTIRARTTDFRAAGEDAASNAFDYLWAILVCSVVSGVLIDGWAHNRGLADDSFFTPWHGVLYGAYVVSSGVLLLRVVQQRGSLLSGYRWAAAGAIGFGAAGVGDLAWHGAFGFESGVEASLSPPHIVLAISLAMMALAPAINAWNRSEPTVSLVNLLPTLVGLTAMLILIAYLTQFAHPYVVNWAAPVPGWRETVGDGHMDYQHLPQSRVLPEADAPLVDRVAGESIAVTRPATGVLGILVQNAVILGTVMLLIRRWNLPFGACTLTLSAYAVALTVLRGTYQWIPVAAVAGLVTDLLLRSKARMPVRHVLAADHFLGADHAEATGSQTAFDASAIAWRMRLVGTLLGPLLWIPYFIVLDWMNQLAWEIHLTGGVVVLSSLTGIALAELARPADFCVDDR